jgi:prepilin-type processing-associated H-X9-DG protein
VDFNSNGVVCPVIPKTDGSPSDKDFFFKMGLFFIENGNGQPPTIRHYTIGQVFDGMSNTVLLSENARTGVDPAQPDTNWAACNPYLTGFYIGNPCPNGNCAKGTVDYNLANSGAGAINAGLSAPEGSSPRPNSFHPGGVHFGFGDGRVKFVSQSIAGGVYAAMVSPQGGRLSKTALQQAVPSDLDY